MCSLTTKHTRVVSIKCTPGFACRAFSDTTLACFIVNVYTTKCSPYNNTAIAVVETTPNFEHTKRHRRTTRCLIWVIWRTFATFQRDRLSWWRHQMEPFYALLVLCAGISPVSVNSPHKGQWREALMFSLICAWINDWVDNREAGDLRRHHGHYDVIVMCK